MKRRGFLFDQVKVRAPKYSAFDLSYENRFTTNFGVLVPSAMYEVIPGDIFDLTTNAYIQAAPMVAPAMQRMDLMIYNFYIPYRLCCDEWDDFISNGNGKVKMNAQSEWQAPVMPYFTLAQVFGEQGQPPFSVRTIYNQYKGGNEAFSPGTLADFLNVHYTGNGAPGEEFVTMPISAMPFRAYQLVYNYFFRDQNLEDEVEVNTSSGPVTVDELKSILQLRYKAWEKDYFTSALPSAQRGAPVQIPTNITLNGYADLSGAISTVDHAYDTPAGYAGGFAVVDATNNHNFTTRPYQDKYGLVNGDDNEELTDTEGYVQPFLSPQGDKQNVKLAGPIVDIMGNTGVHAPLVSNGPIQTSTTIEDLRHAFRLQEWLEKSARFGSRIVESILGHFGERVPDYRVDKPEFLSSTRIPLQVNSLSQTSATSIDGSTTPIAYKSGQAQGSGSGARFNRKFVEHGIILQLACVMPRSSYSQGIPRMYTRQGFEDYAWPEFDQLGEQEIKNHELFFGSSGEDPMGTFGYTPRYAEYKYHHDECHSDYQPGKSLAYWTATRDVSSNHVLNNSFIKFSPGEANRIFAITSETVGHFYIDMWHSCKAIRHLHEYGTPTF